MKKFLTILTLCLVSVISFGQYEYTKILHSNSLSDNDTVILYCEDLNVTLDSLMIDSFKTSGDTYNKQCYGINIHNTLDSAMCFIVHHNEIIHHISLYTLNHTLIYCGQYTSSLRNRWWGIGTYLNRNEFEEAVPCIILDKSFISGLRAGRRYDKNTICFCTSDFWGGSISATKSVSIYKKSFKSTSTALNTLNNNIIEKHLENGMVVIEKNGIKYNLLGIKLTSL